ncbi:S-adenosyl-L-methionine-dependent methyltransferase [Syncephalis pseudoplumigaleata]|uniref:Protein-lysine N-methyltransferase EFM4 n=1 Tax=Syncephalis pseudoplumigaleata TaxID=1712513 RepID=A0A4V1J1G6_9FUNG|nr:S-adenosyl-L-methionine-dependent methyltransferase [Syncephalis pseudoplumigaleata]|eukprot:RKP24989.1 S-adenosyl-L-methionine-dependent methyltransferase [Syncephalis pseudoplumigaleata]
MQSAERDLESTTQELNPSKLGTKDYWDKAYERELAQYEDSGDMGEVFGEDAAERMADWLMDHVAERDAPMVDLGCGNGHLLLTLAEAGFTRLMGVDYSPAAIALASAVAEERALTDTIRYEQLDLLTLVDAAATAADAEHRARWRGRFHVVLDKGTYDAISLHPDQKAARDEGKAGPADHYVDAAAHLLDDSETGLLLITSCNWTQDELVHRFHKRFVYYGHVHYPTFTFGGATGQSISTVAFRKRTEEDMASH